jgi:hypothetical protein
VTKFPSRDSIRRAADVASIEMPDAYDQDWPITKSNDARLPEFLMALEAHARDWEVAYWLIDLVLESARGRVDLSAWEDPIIRALSTVLASTRSPAIVERLEYWACRDSDLEDAFEVAPLVRGVLAAHATRKP